MSSTQRSEGMNAFFGKFIHQRSKLAVFVKQYDNCLADKASKEMFADHSQTLGDIPLQSDLMVEKQFQMAYTHDMFRKVKAEHTKSLNCSSKIIHDSSVQLVCEVVEDVLINWEDVEFSVEKHFKVTMDRTNMDFSCQCLLFEFKGIVCRHCFRVLQDQRVRMLHGKYVLDRWNRHINRRHSKIRCAHDEGFGEPRKLRHKNISLLVNDMVERASVTEKETLRFLDFLRGYIFNDDDVDDRVEELHAIQLPSHLVDAQDPPMVKSKGRPESRRKRSATDSIREAHARGGRSKKNTR